MLYGWSIIKWKNEYLLYNINIYQKLNTIQLMSFWSETTDGWSPQNSYIATKTNSNPPQLRWVILVHDTDSWCGVVIGTNFVVLSCFVHLSLHLSTSLSTSPPINQPFNSQQNFETLPLPGIVPFYPTASTNSYLFICDNKALLILIHVSIVFSARLATFYLPVCGSAC